MQFDHDTQRDSSAGQSGASSSRPVCPACESQRLTACPVCGTTGGEHFYDAGVGLVDDDRPETAQTALLVCQTCDEAFTPEYPRRCEWCGYDFGQGSEIPSDDASQELAYARTVATVVAVIALLSAVWGMFAMMF